VALNPTGTGTTNLQPASAIAASFNNRETGHSARQLGFSTTDFDADLCALATATAQAITNLRPHPGQSSSRKFCTTMTQILSNFRNTRVSIEWCPSEISIAGIHRCIDLARETATAPFPPSHREPNTVAFQKATSKQLAISAWQARWHNANRRTQAYLALPSPPSGTVTDKPTSVVDTC